LDRFHLIKELEKYSSSFPEELLLVAQFRTLLQHPRSFFRDHLPGHITGSAWITNSYFTKTVLLQHAKLKKWLQPGGHADGDENILSVAQRELHEETGLENAALKIDSIFDIDIHSIPASEQFPEHYHYDIRYLFVADESDLIKGNHESREIQWVSFSQLSNFSQEKSIVRMREKLATLNAIWN